MPTPEEIENLLDIFYSPEPDNRALAIQIGEAIGYEWNLKAVVEIATFLNKRAWRYPYYSNKKLVSYLREIIEQRKVNLTEISARSQSYPIDILDIKEQLEEIFINNHNAHLPSFANELTRLKKVYMSLILEEVSPSFFEIPHLEEAYLCFNALARIPQKLQQLQHLRSLWLCAPQMEFSKLGDTMPQLQQLTIENSFYIRKRKHRWRRRNIAYFVHNKKTFQIPNNIFNLQSLRDLSLIGKQIEELPQQLQTSRLLTTLNIIYTSIKDLPLTLKRLPHLEKLSWHGAEHLRELPPVLFEIPLQHLDLVACPKLRLTKDFKRLSHLKSLSIRVGKPIRDKIPYHRYLLFETYHQTAPWTGKEYDKIVWREQLQVWLPNTKIIID